MQRRLFALLVLLCWALVGAFVLPASAAGEQDLGTAFAGLRNMSVWPVASSTDHIAKDATRGVDIVATDGADVYAATSGVLWQVTTGTNGVTAIMVQHAFVTPVQFSGTAVAHYYTLYGELDRVAPELLTAAAEGAHPYIAAGAVLGSLGRRANVVHFEVRVGTWCTLDYQRAHPASACAGYGFDPQVSSMSLFRNDGSVRVAGNARTGSHVSTQTSAVGLQEHFDAASTTAVAEITMRAPRCTALFFGDRTAPSVPLALIHPRFFAAYDSVQAHANSVLRQAWGRNISAVA